MQEKQAGKVSPKAARSTPAPNGGAERLSLLLHPVLEQYEERFNTLEVGLEQPGGGA